LKLDACNYRLSAHLHGNAVNYVRYVVARGLAILRRMQQSVTRRSQFVEIGLSRLYDVELIAKYAYSGFLGNH